MYRLPALRNRSHLGEWTTLRVISQQQSRSACTGRLHMRCILSSTRAAFVVGYTGMPIEELVGTGVRATLGERTNMVNREDKEGL